MHSPRIHLLAGERTPQPSSSGSIQQSFENSIGAHAATPAKELPLTYVKELALNGERLPRGTAHLVDLPTYEIPSRAFGYWLYKSSDTTADFPEEYIQNTSNFAGQNKKQNSDFKSEIITNNPHRLRENLPLELEAQDILHIAPVDYDFGSEFPLLGKLAEAAVSQAPELAKDLLALKDLRNHGGILSDPDTTWPKPKRQDTKWEDTEWEEYGIPSPFVIDGPIAAHRKTENSVIAYAGKSETNDILGDILRHAETQIPKLFKDTENFKLAEPMTKSSLVNKLFYNFYVEKLEKRNSPALSLYADYDTPISRYAQNEETIQGLTSKKKDR